MVDGDLGKQIYECLKQKGNEAAVSILLSRAEDGKTSLYKWTDENGFHLLHWAAMAGCEEIVLFLLHDAKVDPNVRGPNLQTPLMWAATEERILTMKLLREAGADVHARDDLGAQYAPSIPTHILGDNLVTLAAQHEKLMSCLWALKHGADADCCNITGTSAGHWAAFSGAYLLLCALETFGANLETSYDHYGLLPLHRALQLEFYATAKMLIDLRPSLLHARTKEGLTLTEFAVKSELSSLWFNEFMEMCTNPKHVVVPKKAMLGLQSGTPTACPSPGDSSLTKARRLLRKCLNIRAYLWDALANSLMRMESSSVGRGCIPGLAILFAAIFILAWRLELSRFSAWLIQITVSLLTPIWAKPVNFLLRAPPYFGAASVALFAALLIIDPGIVPRASSRLPIFEPIQARLEDVVFLVDSTKLEAQQNTSPRLYSWLLKNGVSPSLISKQVSTNARRARQRKALAFVDLGRVCPTCWIIKGLRTKHCSVCDSCCKILDHHCVWLNKCVGENNHRLFAIFVLLAAVAQCHQILLLILDIGMALVCPWFKISHPTGLNPPVRWITVITMLMTVIVHFITYRWSWALVGSQLQDIVEGITINESLSAARYPHFICEVPYTYSPEKLAAVDEALREDHMFATTHKPTGDYNVLEGKVGKEVVRASKPADQNEVIIRHFIRNPFTLDQSSFKNCLDFWIKRVPTEIDWDRLEMFDVSFREKTIAALRQREIEILTMNKKLD